jgi:hypothetical protein
MGKSALFTGKKTRFGRSLESVRKKKANSGTKRSKLSSRMRSSRYGYKKLYKNTFEHLYSN